MATQKRKLHILVVVRWPVGGIRTFLRYVYGRFPVDRFKFIFIYPETSESQAIKSDLQHLDINHVMTSKFPSVMEFTKIVYRCLRKFSIDILHSHGFTSGICSVIPAKLTGTSHLMTSHDVFTKKQFQGVAGVVKKQFLSSFFQKIDLIHCVSFDARENLLAYLPVLKKNADQVVVIPNGIESKRFLTNERKDFRLEYKLEDNIFLIGFFGRFMSQKGFRFLVQAVEILQKRSLPKKVMVFCFGWGGFVREEQTVLKQKGLADFFVFLPFQDNIASYLRGLDVVAMPSLWEACPLLAMESMVAGILLIGTDCVGLREVIKNTPAYMIPPRDANALADAIEKEIRTPSKEEVERFRATAALRFDVKKQEVALRGIIEDLCKQSREI